MSNTHIFAEERQNKILSLLRVRNKILVSNLCEEFGVSSATIRNDLNQLEKSGLLKRTHGGAIPSMKIMEELTSSQKYKTNFDQKKRIAECAESFIENGDTIALDTGTTTYALACALANKQDLIVITADIRIAGLLEEFSGVSVVLAGGELRKGFSCTTGSITNNTLSSLKVDKIFLATNAIDSNGTLSTPDIEQAYVKKTMINMGKEIFLLCDSSKFGRQSFSRFGSISDIDYIITDTGFDPDILKDLDMNEITVITV